MHVAELMQTDVRSVAADAPIAEAIASMAEAHVYALPVVGDGGRLLGVVSASDVLAVEAEHDPEALPGLLERTPVREIMTPRAYAVTPDADVRDAARQMLYADVHRLFVEEHERLVGVISSTDIVRAVAHRKV